MSETNGTAIDKKGAPKTEKLLSGTEDTHDAASIKYWSWQPCNGFGYVFMAICLDVLSLIEGTFSMQVMPAEWRSESVGALDLANQSAAPLPRPIVRPLLMRL